MARPIQDYAVIGDCRSAALVSRDGSIDWLCWPRFDSPPLFGAILDEGAGSWSVTPTGPFRTARRYVEGTNVLETRFETAGGALLLTDLMPVASEEEKKKLLLPDHHLLRQLECLRGEVEVEIAFRPRHGFTRSPVRWRDEGKLGMRIETGSGLLMLRSDLPLGVPRNGELRGRARLRAGEVRHLSLTFDDQWAAILPPLGEPMRETISRSVEWWRRWSSQLTYEGPRREAVLRSALALKLLVYAPSGAIVAAPTTSLPERIGGDLNWDYRFCWLRDASLTTRALFGLGFAPEAEAFSSWLLQSAPGGSPTRASGSRAREGLFTPTRTSSAGPPSIASSRWRRRDTCADCPCRSSAGLATSYAVRWRAGAGTRGSGATSLASTATRSTRARSCSPGTDSRKPPPTG